MTQDNKSKLRRYLEYSALVLAAILLAAESQGWFTQTRDIEQVASRKSMPQLELPLLGGGSWRLEDHRGQVVLINFWASWCPPCRQETPGLVQLAKDYESKGLTVVAVAMDDSGKNGVQAFIDEFHLPYPVALPDLSSPLVSAVESLPTTILVDRQGREAKTYMGAVRESLVQADVERLLAETPEPQQQRRL